MKRFVLPLLALTLFAATPPVQAGPPQGHEPPARKLSERVPQATHIFVGVIRSVTVMDKSGEVKSEPQPEQLTPENSVLFEVEVEEALKPTGWKPVGTVKVPLKGNYIRLSAYREGIGKRFVFLTRIDFAPKDGPRFKAENDNELVETLDKKAEIAALLTPQPELSQVVGRRCKVHGDVFRPDSVLIQYGMPIIDDYDFKRYTAGKKLFPNSHREVMGGCVTWKGQPTHRIVPFCPRCREVEKQWMKEHPRVK